MKSQTTGVMYLLYARADEVLVVRIVRWVLMVYHLVLQEAAGRGIYYLRVDDLEKHLHIFAERMLWSKPEIYQSDGTSCPAVQWYLRAFKDPEGGRLISWTLGPIYEMDEVEDWCRKEGETLASVMSWGEIKDAARELLETIEGAKNLE